MRKQIAHIMIALAIASPTLAAEPGKAQLQKVPALRETQVNGAQGENAHGVAIWTPQDKSQARVIGAQPQGELNIYDLSGVILQRLGVRAPRAVDVRNHFTWIESDGAILAATDNSDRSIVFYKLDPKTGLADAKSRGRIRTKIKDMSAVCLSQSGADFVMVAAGKAGDVHAWTLALDPWRDVTGIKIAETQFHPAPSMTKPARFISLRPRAGSGAWIRRTSKASALWWIRFSQRADAWPIR